MRLNKDIYLYNKIKQVMKDEYIKIKYKQNERNEKYNIVEYMKIITDK